MKKKSGLVITAFICALLVIGAVITFKTIEKRKADRTVNIAFYGLSENYVNLIKESIPVSEDLIVNFTVLADNCPDTAALISKYDMFFTWKGQLTSELEISAEEIPGKILENIPISLRNKKCLPLLLDHYELDFYEEVLNKTGYKYDGNYVNFLNYLNDAKAYVFVPFFLAGGNDRNLLAVIGSFIEAAGGTAAYNNFINLLKSAENLDSILDEKLAEGLTLRSVLDLLAFWPSEGLTHPGWTSGNNSDLVSFTDMNQIGCFFTDLSTHRKMAFKTVSKFETTAFPRLDDSVSHSVVAPAVCGMLLSNNANAKKFLRDLMTEEVQTKMSVATMLAPVHYRAECYDKEADDVRYWAASCAGGAVPDPALAVYQKNSDSLAAFAKEIRTYLMIHKS